MCLRAESSVPLHYSQFLLTQHILSKYTAYFFWVCVFGHNLHVWDTQHNLKKYTEIFCLSCCVFARWKFCSLALLPVLIDTAHSKQVHCVFFLSLRVWSQPACMRHTAQPKKVHYGGTKVMPTLVDELLLGSWTAFSQAKNKKAPLTPLRILAGLKARGVPKGYEVKKKSPTPPVTLIRFLSQNGMWGSPPIFYSVFALRGVLHTHKLSTT